MKPGPDGSKSAAILAILEIPSTIWDVCDLIPGATYPRVSGLIHHLIRLGQVVRGGYAATPYGRRLRLYLRSAQVVRVPAPDSSSSR